LFQQIISFQFSRKPGSSEIYIKPKQYLTLKNKICHTLRFLLRMGQRAKSSKANVTIAKACQVVGRRDAKQMEANMPAFNDNA